MTRLPQCIHSFGKADHILFLIAIVFYVKLHICAELYSGSSLSWVSPQSDWNDGVKLNKLVKNHGGRLPPPETLSRRPDNWEDNIQKGENWENNIQKGKNWEDNIQKGENWEDNIQKGKNWEDNIQKGENWEDNIQKGEKWGTTSRKVRTGSTRSKKVRGEQPQEG